MSRIGDNYRRSDLWLQSEQPAPADLLTTQVQPGESSLLQVAQRLKMLLDLLVQMNPQIQNPNALQVGQPVFYPKGAPQNQTPAETPSHPFSAQQAAGMRMESGLDAMMRRQMFVAQQGPGPAPGLGQPQRPDTIPAFDPQRGPQITKDLWTPQMLTGDLTADQLRNVADPAGFLNARLKAVQQPTDALWIDTRTGASQVVNPSQISSMDQAEGILARLRSLGYSGPGVEEIRPENPFSRIDYKGDPRRHHYINGMNVGLLIERYAKYPKEVADQMTLAELRQIQPRPGE